MGRLTSCSNRCTKESCELCSCINAKPVDIERHGAKLLTVRVRINNVCLDKKVAIAVILYDDCDRIVAFKGFVTMAQEERSCDHDVCGSRIVAMSFCEPRSWTRVLSS